jgi:hypothetical protein
MTRFFALTRHALKSAVGERKTIESRPSGRGTNTVHAGGSLNTIAEQDETGFRARIRGEIHEIAAGSERQPGARRGELLVTGTG